MQLSIQSSTLILLSMSLVQPAIGAPVSERGVAGDILKGPVLSGAKGGASAANAANPGALQSAEDAVKSAVQRREPQLSGIAGAAEDLASLGKSAAGAAKGGSKADTSVAKGQQKQADTNQQAGVNGIEVETRQLSGIAGAAEDLASLGKSAAGAAKGGSKVDTSVAKGQQKQADTSQQAGVNGIEVETRDGEVEDELEF